MTDDLILIRRASPAMYGTQNNPILICSIQEGKFELTRAAAGLLGITDKGGIMFAFNKGAKTAYVTPDDEPDAFMVTRKNDYRYRFASAVVRNYFIETFGIDRWQRKTYYFDMAKEPNNKGFYQIKLKA